MSAQTKDSQSKLTIEDIKQLLIDGNQRFLDGNMLNHNLLEQLKETARHGQFPHTVVLGCVDSRVIPEKTFDVGIGDIFSIRVAGNIVDETVLASLEFSCKIAGAKYVLVKGHTNCGAVTAACEGHELGHLSELLAKIKPSVDKVRPQFADITSTDAINLAVEYNVLNSIDEIRKGSSVLREMEEQGLIEIAGAIYDIHTGKVKFL